MPKLTISGKTLDVTQGKRLVLAIEESGVALGHRCGGNARCTTCRVKFEAGEPETMTQAEYIRLSETGLLGEARLSCQIVCDHDMSVIPLVTADTKPEWDGDTGPAPAEQVTPAAEWYLLEDLKANG